MIVGLSTLGVAGGTPQAVAAPPPAVVVASGTPATAAGTLWGTPTVGGAYTYPYGTGGTSPTGSGAGDRGLLQTDKGMTASVVLPAVSQRDVSVDNTFVVEQAPAIGSGVKYSLMARVDGKACYRAAVQILANKPATISLARVDAAGVVSGSVSYDLPSLVVGTKYRMQFEVVGDQQPSLRLRLFADGTPAPDWQLQSTDTAAGSLTGAGALGFMTYTSSNSELARIRVHAFEAKSVPPANVPPVASFTASAPNLLASFDATASKDTDGTVTAYAWNFGDGTTGTGAKATYAYTKAGTSTVALTVTDDSGAKTTTTRTVSPSWPGPDNTGVPAGTVLKPYPGPWRIEQDGTVLDGYDFSGGDLVIKAKNVTIRNFLLPWIDEPAEPGPDAPRRLLRDHRGLHLHADASRTRHPRRLGRERHATPGRGHEDHRRDADRLRQRPRRGLVVPRQRRPPAPGHDDGWTHSDSVQIENGSNMVFQRNRMESPHTSVFTFSQNEVKDDPAVSNIRIEGNYLDGGACTVNFKNAASAPRPAPTGVTIADNTFGRGQQYANCGVRITAGWPLDLRNNFFVDGVAVGRTHFVDP